ncbi:MAG: L-threonylcarbamoyladenylate synthase [Steroidobacteraceae bacterium]|nr:L-threonylcarbamoyladenylate synthase [Steroidobacteraceae bacterium]
MSVSACSAIAGRTSAGASTDVAAAAARLRAGELVAFPTETVYGLGADARDPVAVARIYALKGRPPGHPLIVHLASAAALDDWARDVPAAARALAARFWPGPLTLVLKRARSVPDAVTGGQDSVGLRVPSHPVARELLAAFGGGVAAPSANRYGRVSPTRARHVLDEFGADAPLVLDGGDCEVGLESTILALLDEPLLLRPGHVTRAALEAVIGPVRVARAGEGPRAPGTTQSHYAPATGARLVPGVELAAAASSDARRAVLALGAAPPGYAGPLWIDAGRDAVRYAHDLYANLRRLDAAGAAEILVEAVPPSADWDAVRDRLARACKPGTLP